MDSRAFGKWCAVVAVGVLPSTGISAPVRATLSNPQVRLWYEETGRLSGNIAPPASVNLWNTCIGEGDAQENANDALFSVEIRTSGEANVPTPITLSATASNGKIVARRTFSSTLTSTSGRAILALWVPEIGCGGGEVLFTARMGTAVRTVKLNFEGGE